MIDTYISEHAIYEDNQLLTSDQLNKSFKHLEQQILTRSAVLTDTGVVQGFTYDVYHASGNITSITLHTGFAVTPDGYLIPGTDENGIDYNTRIYTNYRQFNIAPADFNEYCRNALFSDPDDSPAQNPVMCYELFTSAISGSSSLAFQYSTFNEQYLLAWYIDLVEEEVDSCNSNSCDDGGKRRTEVPRLLLVPKKQLNNELFKPINRPLIKHRSIHVKRFGGDNLYDSLSWTQLTKIKRNDLYIAANNTAQTNLVTIYNELKSISNAGLVPDRYTRFVKSNQYAQIYAKLDSLRQQAANFKNQASQANHDYTKDNFLQPYISFCQDMEMAINEFYAGLNSLNNIIWNSPINGGRRMRFVVLGELADPKPSWDRYRYFKANLSQLYNETLDLMQEVGTLSDRMWLMVDRVMYATMSLLPSNVAIPFNQADRLVLDKAIKALTNNSPETIRITPSRMTPSKLGEMAIPYYYNIRGSNESDPLWQVWKAGLKDKRNLNDIYNYYDYESAETLRASNLSYATTYNQNEYPMLRIEGLMQTSLERSNAPIFQNAKRNSRAWSILGPIAALQTYRRALNLSFGIYSLDLDGPVKNRRNITGIAGEHIERRTQWSEYVNQQAGYTNFIPGADFGEYVVRNGSLILLLSHSHIVGVLNLPFMLPNTLNVSKGLFEFLECYNDNYPVENEEWNYVGSGVKMMNLQPVPDFANNYYRNFIPSSGGGIMEPLRFRKADGYLYIRGSIEIPSYNVSIYALSVVFLLPTDYIPEFEFVQPVQALVGNQYITVSSVITTNNGGLILSVIGDIPNGATVGIFLNIQVPLN